MKVVPLYSRVGINMCILKWTQMDTNMDDQIVHVQKDVKEIISIQKTFYIIPFFYSIRVEKFVQFNDINKISFEKYGLLNEATLSIWIE